MKSLLAGFAWYGLVSAAGLVTLAWAGVIADYVMWRFL
jgi:hypothetical protein